MPADKFGEQKIIRDLGDGLVLRRATREDTEALVTFNARIHGNLEKGERDDRARALLKSLFPKQVSSVSPVA